VAVGDVVAQFPADVDAIVYGCTHYPLLDAHFAAIVPSAARIDPAREQARAVTALRLPSGGGTTLYVTNGDSVAFERNVRKWTGRRHPAASPHYRHRHDDRGGASTSA